MTAPSGAPLGGCGGQVVHLLCLALEVVSRARCPVVCANCSQGHGSVSPGHPSTPPPCSLPFLRGVTLRGMGDPGGSVPPRGLPGAGQRGRSLGALGRLALALVVQDALDQVVVLVQHLREKRV